MNFANSLVGQGNWNQVEVPTEAPLPATITHGLISCNQLKALEMLRRYADKALKEVEFSFSVFISKDEDKLSYIVTADKNLSAKSIISKVNECFAGSGGGRDDFAQGGSQDLDNIESKFEQLEDNLKN